MDLPDTLEAYFQEAGRAGRDERKAYAILLYEQADIIHLENTFKLSYPELPLIQDIYQALCNYYRIPVGSGEGLSFEFDNNDFATTYKQNPLSTYHALKFVEKAGLIVFTDPYSNASKIYIHCSREDLYRFQVENPYFDAFIKLLLRSYAGLLTDFTRIYENELAKRANIPLQTIIDVLHKLHHLGILIYQPQTELPRIVFLANRFESKYLMLSETIYKERMQSDREKLDAVIQYVTNQTKCRSRQLLAYFGESESIRCGKCDVCLERNKIELSSLEFDNVLDIIKPILTKSDVSIDELIEKTHFSEEKTVKVLQWLLDNNKIVYTEEKKLRWHEL
jgi:ATP-dependent DNA helicase RecQ